MSAIKVGTTLSISAEDSTLHFDNFDHYYSSYWETDLDLEEAIDKVESLFDPSPSSEVVVEGSTQLEDTEYGELKEIQGDELDAEFVSIYANNYVLSWEETNDGYQMGLRSRKFSSEEVIRLFEESADEELSLEDRERVSEFLSHGE